MISKELLKHITIIVHYEFKKTNDLLKTLLKRQDEIRAHMTTKADIRELTKTIHKYMELTRIYRDKQIELEKQIEEILEYLGIADN